MVGVMGVLLVHIALATPVFRSSERVKKMEQPKRQCGEVQKRSSLSPVTLKQEQQQQTPTLLVVVDGGL